MCKPNHDHCSETHQIVSHINVVDCCGACREPKVSSSVEHTFIPGGHPVRVALGSVGYEVKPGSRLAFKVQVEKHDHVLDTYEEIASFTFQCTAPLGLPADSQRIVLRDTRPTWYSDLDATCKFST